MGEKKNHNCFTFRPVVIIMKEKCYGLVRVLKYHLNWRNQHSYSLKPYLKLFELQSKFTSKALRISEILHSRPNTRLLLELFFSIDWRCLLWGLEHNAPGVAATGAKCRFSQWKRWMKVVSSPSAFTGASHSALGRCTHTHTHSCMPAHGSVIGYNKVV